MPLKEIDMDKPLQDLEPSQIKVVYFAYIWHGFFLGITMSMLDLNTVFPALVSELTSSKVIFGLLYAIMLGAPLVFNLIFSHYLRAQQYKKKFLLLGIYMRAFAFLGMALSTLLFALKSPFIAVLSFFVWVFLFSISAGFAGIAYTDVIGKVLQSKQRPKLYATKQLFGSIASFAGGILITRLFKPGNLAFPNNYALSLFIGFVGLALASIGFYHIKEPASSNVPKKGQRLSAYIRDVPRVLKEDTQFRRFILLENLTSFSVMILPFYMIYAKETFNLDQSYIGQYLLFQLTGTVLSNFVWGFIAGRTDSRFVVRICIFLGASIPVIAIVMAQTNPNLYSIVFFLIGFIITGRRIGFEPYLLDIAPDEHRTEYLGIRGTLNIFIVILPILGGFLISQFGYTPVFILVTIVMIFSGLLAKQPSNSTNA